MVKGSELNIDLHIKVGEYEEILTPRCRLCGDSYEILNHYPRPDWQYLYCCEECRDADKTILEFEKLNKIISISLTK